MPIKLNKNCHNRDVFLAAHALGYVPGPFAVVPVGGFPVGTDFFTIGSDPLAYMQGLIDTTYEMRKKLTYLGGNALNAKQLIEQASTGSGISHKVRWGVHQSQNRPLGVTGKCEHFTIEGNPDWHLYISSNGSRISFMSDGPVNYTQIDKY